MTNQADRAINITIKEVELVEVGKEKHDETLAKIEAKADKAEVDSLKKTVNENQTQLQEQLQSQSEIINTKLDESQVKALIAEAELDDLTLEQVQEEVIKRVADKASTQAVNEANQAQDAKINAKADISYVDGIKQSLQDKDAELEQSLASKANASALDELKEQLTAFVGSDIEDKPTNQRVDEIARSVETKADKEHAHSVGDITGLTETLASKADATHAHSLDDITGLNDKLSTLASSEAVNTLQEQVQSQSELISGKLDEEAVKALIAEAELDDLTLEQVQQEIIKQVADKASSRAVAEANQAQDTKIDSKADTSYVDNIKQSLEDKDGELEESLAGKANAAHTHSFDEITDKPETYTPSEHSHTIDDITGLNDRLSTLVTNEALQNLLKQYSPITVKTTVEQLQNSLEAKADNTQLESLRELIESVSGELTAKIQELSQQLKQMTTASSKEPRSEESRSDVPDPAPARAEEPVAVSDETDDAIEGQDPEIKRIIDNLTLDSYQEVMGNDKRPVNTTIFDRVRIKFNKEVEDSSWATDFPSVLFNKDSEGYYTATNVNGATMLSGYFSMYDAEDPSVQIVEVVFIDRGVKYVKKFDLIPEDDTDRRQRKYSNTW